MSDVATGRVVMIADSPGCRFPKTKASFYFQFVLDLRSFQFVQPLTIKCSCMIWGQGKCREVTEEGRPTNYSCFPDFFPCL